jgi:hypothetical protein
MQALSAREAVRVGSCGRCGWINAFTLHPTTDGRLNGGHVVFLRTGNQSQDLVIIVIVG